MPELPEVEALAVTLTQRTAGMFLSRFEVAAVNALKTFDPPVSATVGCAVLGFSRRGKHLVLELVDDAGEPLAVVTHLGRAGWVRWRDDPPPPRRAMTRGSGLAVRIGFTPDLAVPTPTAAIEITEAGTQKRLAVHIVRDPSEIPRVATLGPEPLSDEFDAGSLDRILDAAGRAQIKGVLRDQSLIAGIGNAYSDEILHASRLSPFAPASTSDAGSRAALLASIKAVLARAVSAAVATDPSGLKAEKKANMAVHGRTGEKCPVCGTGVREVSFADSSLQYCPGCQTGGRLLADRRMSRLLK